MFISMDLVGEKDCCKAVVRVDAIDSVFDSGTEKKPTYTVSLRNGDKFTSAGTAEEFVGEHLDKSHAVKKGKASH